MLIRLIIHNSTEEGTGRSQTEAAAAGSHVPRVKAATHTT